MKVFDDGSVIVANFSALAQLPFDLKVAQGVPHKVLETIKYPISLYNGQFAGILS